jgi:leucyl aminopeptidase
MSRPESHPLPLVTSAPGAVETDLIAIPTFEADDFGDIPGVDAATGGEVTRATSAREVTGKPFDVFVTPVTHHWKSRRVMLVGAGPRAAWDPERARKVAAVAALAARQRRVPRLSICARHGEGSSTRVLQAMAEGLVLSQLDTARHKSTPPDVSRLTDVRIVAAELPSALRAQAAEAIERGRILGDSTNLARAVGNEPSNHLTPRLLVERAVAAVADTQLEVDILDVERLREINAGLLLGVAQGSAEPARMLVLRHRPDGAPDAPVLGLVGKGVTFDTGGISIKPADGMERMKVDMAGGAAVVGAMRALSLLKAPIGVVGIVPAAENMPGGKAIKPGDVLTSAAGTTVEVVNTDAEGRLILADALWYAGQLGATHLVDVATLTGACVVALGRFFSGLFAAPSSFAEAIRRTADLTGDRCWPLPVTDDYLDQLRSDGADLVNTGGRPAGAVTAAVFLKQFSGGRPWAHLDIAGTAWLDEAKPFMAKGATGAATRLLAELALAPEAWAPARH